MSKTQFDLMLKSSIEKSIAEPEYEYTAVIEVSSIKVPVLAVQSITFRHDYINNLFPDNAVTVAVTPSSYHDLMARAADRIWVTLTKKPYLGTVTETVKYVGIIVNKSNARIEGNTEESLEAAALDNSDLKLVTLQLMDEASYDIRLRSFGGIFLKSTGLGLLKFILASINLQGQYGNDAQVGSVNTTGEPYARVYEQLKIPEGTPLLAIPDYIQDNYGVYNSGLGVFFKNRNWYVFPPWAVSRQQSGVKTLAVLNAPANQYTGLDRTYFERGKTLTVIATGETKFSSETDTNNLNLGTAVRFGDAEKIMGGVTSEDPAADPIVHAKDYITEYGHEDYKGSLQNVVTSRDRFISNPAVPASELARRGGDVVTVTWYNGNIDLLRPGMPVIFYYRNTHAVEELKGVLISALSHSSIVGGLMEGRHSRYVSLNLFLKRGS